MAERNLDHPATLALAIWLGIVGSIIVLVLPVFVGALVTRGGFSEAAAGWIVSGDLLGYAASSILAYRIIRRWNWRTIVVTGLVLIVAGDTLSMFLDSAEALFATRVLLSGIGAGLVISVPYTLLGDTTRPERNTGIYWAINVLGGALALYFVPHLIEATDLWALFAFFGALGLVSIPLALVWLPASGRERGTTAGSTSPTRGVWHILVAIALFNIGMGGVWAFVERMAVGSGIDSGTASTVLAATYFVSVAGALTASWQGAKLGFRVPYAMGVSAMLIALLLLSDISSVLIFVIAMVLVNFGWNYALPFQFSAVYATDSAGRKAVFVLPAQSVGLMLGPAAAGMLVASSGSDAALVLGGTCCLASLVLFLTSGRA